MKPFHRVLTAGIVAVFLLGTIAAAWLFLRPQTISDGALIFTISCVAVIACVIAFVRSNEKNVDEIVRLRDGGALRRLVFGARRSALPSRRKD